jgi:AraC family transcriptional regulator
MKKKEILFIKNMVCNRCIMVVEQLFNKHGYKPQTVTLGEVHLDEKLNHIDTIKKELQNYGFSLIDDKKSQLISGVKAQVIKWVQEYNFNHTPLKFSVFIEKEIGKDYTYLSNLFSDVEGQTIEQYLILQRIEKVKEHLVYDELSLNEIALKTGYSSGSHLSAQFKKVTGLTPSHFKKIKESKRKPIDDL